MKNMKVVTTNTDLVGIISICFWLTKFYGKISLYYPNHLSNFPPSLLWLAKYVLFKVFFSSQRYKRYGMVGIGKNLRLFQSNEIIYVSSKFQISKLLWLIEVSLSDFLFPWSANNDPIGSNYYKLIFDISDFLQENWPRKQVAVSLSYK